MIRGALLNSYNVCLRARIDEWFKNRDNGDQYMALIFPYVKDSTRGAGEVRKDLIIFFIDE
jgi:hypothetical protein